jgi:hypothetical protein
MYNVCVCVGGKTLCLPLSHLTDIKSSDKQIKKIYFFYVLHSIVFSVIIQTVPDNTTNKGVLILLLLSN